MSEEQWEAHVTMMGTLLSSVFVLDPDCPSAKTAAADAMGIIISSMPRRLLPKKLKEVLRESEETANNS